MIALINLHNTLAGHVQRLGPALLPLLARFTFAATLVGYFWASGLTKLGSGIFGIFNPSLGAYAQIFPKAMEAAGYDVSKLSTFHTLVVSAGTLAEFILPLLLIIGLFTRLAAIGMIGFVIVQTLTDLFGHGAITHPETLGAWFDRIPDSLILDQRLFWMVVLVTLVIKGAGPLSLDRLLKLH
ncbi:DoxX family membrane protein [Aliiroseovarius crassostreae]|uniref:DoxX family membrane protein n=1 Tax=Aliiroseovarius crassostreae TaxID=154981 RepID=A0A9Q9LVT9_9RHOB|nr:DoxX family membrane protein [Aliiroseovarius crassostreae]UWP96241.1 DoxX family membrane protein [Aliiroseovarius crassostreae]